MHVRRVALPGLRPPPPVGGGHVERVLRGVDRPRLGEHRGPALQRVGGEVDRGHGEQAGTGRGGAEREVAAVVADGRGAPAGDADLALPEPVLEGTAADQRLVGRLQRVEGLVPVVRAGAGREVGPVLEPVGVREGVGHHQPHALIDAPGGLVRAGEEDLRGDLGIGHVGHVDGGDLRDVARPVAAEGQGVPRPHRRADRMRALDRPGDVDVAEDHHLVPGEEHLPRPAVDRQARRLGHGLRRPRGEEVQPAAGEHGDPRPVVLDEVRLVHPGDLGVGGADAGRARARSRGDRAGAGAHRHPAHADVDVALSDLLDVALHLEHQRVLDRRLELAAARDLGEPGAAVDAQGGGDGVARRARARGKEAEKRGSQG